MTNYIKIWGTFCLTAAILTSCLSCSSDDGSDEPTVVAGPEEVDDTAEGTVTEETSSMLEQYFGSHIDLEALSNYANQSKPSYIVKDNTGSNEITNAKATLGRVLFYDKQLSVDNTVSCSSCHQQSTAFSDMDLVSQGVNGTTGRHSMRLVNSRFSDEVRFFWDERANTLEDQTTMPIQDHLEMGFSGEDGAPSIKDLTEKLADLDYYQELFSFAYGDTAITENRMQEALANFIRSIQSFDSKYDVGRNNAGNDGQDFANFTAEENRGKQLFLLPPDRGGVGCAGCHRAPEFDIDPESLNNGVIGIFASNDIDLTITRSPSLRDVFNSNGVLNGALMHDASKTTFRQVLEHYNDIDATGNNNLDRRLRGGPGQNGQQLNMSEGDMLALEAFIKTLSGSDMYTNPKWSDPFIQ